MAGGRGLLTQAGELWNNPTLVARLQVLLSAVLFGTTGTAQALGPDVPPALVGAGRIVAGGALLLAVATVTRKLQAGGRRGLVAVSGAFVAVYQLTFFAAVAETGVAVAAVVAIGSAPAFTGLLARVFIDERLTRRWAAATALAAAGVGLLVLGSGSGGEVSAAGIGLSLVSGLGYAGYAVAGKRMLDAGGTPEGVMACVFATGAVLLLPVLALAPTGELATPEGLALIVYLGAVPTALAYVLFARGLARIGAGETATLTLAEPLTAAMLGVVVLGERPGALAAIGALLVLSGLAVLAVRTRERPAASTAARPQPAGALS